MKALFHGLIKRKRFANIIMMAFLLGGLFSAASIRQELMPQMAERFVQVEVELPGASPEEIDSSILVLVENAVRGLDGIKRVDSEAREGIGTITMALVENADPGQTLGDIKNAVDRISTFPRQAEAPVVSMPSRVEKALSIIVYGDQPLLWLRRTAESVRDDLATRVGLSKVQLAFPRDQEISIEIPEERLRQHGLRLEDIAGIIKEASLDLPGGSILSPHADITLRTTERRLWADEFADVVISRSAAGIPLRLGDIAELKNGFGDSPIESWFNGKPAIQIDVFSVGEETPISVEKAVRKYLDGFAREHYQGVEMVVFENQAGAYRSRISLLIGNALAGLVLVLAVLGLFLNRRLALWVTMGIPVSLLGGLLVLTLFGASLNMISLFAFIVTIGVVVDDAIMMGEAIHYHRSRGLDRLSAALQGFDEMGGPILLATFTTILAFMPMFFVPADLGQIFRQIPAVIVTVLLISLIESLFILPAHLAGGSSKRSWVPKLEQPQKTLNVKMERFIQNGFRDFIHKVLRRPGLMLACALSCLLITLGAMSGGLLNFSFTPTIESDTVIAQAMLPYGTPKQRSVQIQQKLVDAAHQVLRECGMTSPGVFSLIGTRLEEGEVEAESMTGSHHMSVLVALPPAKRRVLTGREFACSWQKVFGEPAGLEALRFTGETNVGGGEPIRLELFHPDPGVAHAAAISLGERLRGVAGLTAIDDGIRVGKPELKLKLRENGLSMGLTAEELAKQVRHRYHGAEALRFVREGNEIKVMVRLSEHQRKQHDALEEVLLKNPAGALLPLTQVAGVTESKSFTSLHRRDGKRIYPVTADIQSGVSDHAMEDALQEHVLPALTTKFPGLSIGFGGEEEEISEALEALKIGFLVILAVLYITLTLYYDSYAQPLLVLSVIPFSLVGALWGHILMGHDLSIVSVFGIIAMTGVVVNDSLVLVTTYNRNLAGGLKSHQAIVYAACQRFRPTMLTTLTTFLGLLPLILETSEQAQFLIGAAISISFGLVFGTMVTLVLVPSLLYLFLRK